MLGPTTASYRAATTSLASIEMIEAVGGEYFAALLPPLLGAGRAERPDVPAGDLHRRPRLRGGEVHAEFRQPADLSRRLPALDGGDRTRCSHPRPTCEPSGLRTSRPPTCSRCAPGGSVSCLRAPRGRARLRPPVPAPLGALLRYLRGWVPGGAAQRPADPLCEAGWRATFPPAEASAEAGLAFPGPAHVQAPAAGQ